VKVITIIFHCSLSQALPVDIKTEYLATLKNNYFDKKFPHSPPVPAHLYGTPFQKGLFGYYISN
jgi:hypothetical protein